MTNPAPCPDLAAAGPEIGRAAAGHLDRVWRRMMASPEAVAEAHSFRLLTGEPHPLGNAVILREGDDPRVVEAAVAPLQGLTTPVAVFFVDGVSGSIARLLTDQGFAAAPPTPAMAVDLAKVSPTRAPAGCELVRVRSADDGTAWTDVVAAGFELPRGLARRLSPEVHEARPEPDAAVQFFGIRAQGRMVATSMLVLTDGLAGIYCVATLPESRGQGLGAHVTAEALRAARRAGYGVGVLQSSAAGHSVYRTLGFRDVGAVATFIRTPG